MAERETVGVGIFACASGELVISDPCYELGTWCAGVVKAKFGNWHVEVETLDEGDWGSRISKLRAAHSDHLSASTSVHADFEVGVDSGQAGIFDKPIFGNDTAVPVNFSHAGDPVCEDEPWYSYICDHTLRDGKIRASTVIGGVVSSSGFGDGGYDCYLAMRDGKAVAIEIIFIGEDEEDDYTDLDDEDEEDEE